jgi:hypothetical protein
MAVYQISRIQIRRGKINSGTGLPQLSSGEMAWSIDTQELFIGNGAVSEGSPGVGNTKILTTNDLTSQGNILNLIQHIYRSNDTTMSTGIDANNPVARLVQDKLDDGVNLLDFVTDVDILSDDYTASLQRAIDQLFLNLNTKASANTIHGKQSRVTLVLPAGVFKTSSTIYIPSFATIVGAGFDKTFIEYDPTFTITGTTALSNLTLTTTSATASMIGATITGNNIQAGTTVHSVVEGVSLQLTLPATAVGVDQTFTLVPVAPAIQFINDNSNIGTPASITETHYIDQPRHIYVNGLTIQTPTAINTGMQLDCVRDSVFENIKFNGYWDGNGNNALCTGIKMNVFGAVVCENNIFRNIKFTNLVYAVFSKQDILNNIFEDCLVGSYDTPCRQGFVLGLGALGIGHAGEEHGPRNTVILNTKFLNVKQQAVYVDLGSGNSTRNCIYNNVGNDGAGNTGAIYPQIYFNSYGNSSIGDRSDRPDDLGTDNHLFIYKPELGGHGTYAPDLYKKIILGYQTADVLAFRLPCSSDYAGNAEGSITYTVNYFYKSTTHAFTRRGTMTISADITNAQLQLSDEYDIAGSISETNQLKLDFSAKFIDEVGDVYTGALGQTPASIGIYYTNNYSADTGTFTYSYISAS